MRARAIATTTAAAATTAWLVRHRRSAAVRRWEPPAISGARHGQLHARVGGDGDDAVVMLHGMVSTGDVFGRAYDRLADTGRLVVPDLLGFGRSMDTSRMSFSPDAHLDALDELAERTGLFERRWTIGAHSMGSALAMLWAARHADRVDRLVCWGAPMYDSPRTARARINGSRMARLVLLDPTWAERTCAISCRYRGGMGVLTALIEPDLPIPIARTVTQHSWSAYRDGMRYLVLEPDWEELHNHLTERGVEILLAWGTKDPVGDPELGRTLSASSPRSRTVLVPGADHYLPMTHDATCLGHLARHRNP